ncbi:GTPase Era [Robiginitomaculum antarcticum]|uniref:GTPase Era n=1 Tax=Robiginitomaculum antarcticum TaxID=437507 RepID=UPI00035E22E8|nr:GTPase Era [Robiginitomaculum antarcticum]
MSKTDTSRAGFCAVIGAPNAGKSTLTNALVGEKVSIVTHKVQTTRFQIRGIAMLGTSQVVLVDTPGIFAAKSRLDRSMVHAAWTGTKDSSAIIHVVDAPAFARVLSGAQSSSQDRLAAKDTDRVMAGLKKRAENTPVFLALNKIDQVAGEDALPLIAHFGDTGIYDAIVPVSATGGVGMDQLKDLLAAAMPEHPYLFPPDQAADVQSKIIAAEITREKLYLQVHDEIPYESMVETESWKNLRNGDVRIEQVIYVRKDSQKPIILGAGGRTIKAIGAAARRDMQDWLGVKVHLFLFVKVRANWREDKERYTEFGLEFDV